MIHLFNETDFTKTLGSKVSGELYEAYKKIAQLDKITISEAVRRSLISEANSRIASKNETSNSQLESITHPSFNYSATSKPFYSQSNDTKPFYAKDFLEQAKHNREQMTKNVETLSEMGKALFVLFSFTTK
ncbi:MAG: hypothetical protein Q8K64_12375 [Sediminibacterium sp.]|nr:hypothetical protein [Sediminibacterium sp.]